MKERIVKKQERFGNIVVGTILFGALVLIATGVIGCIISAILFGGIIGMAYLG